MTALSIAISTVLRRFVVGVVSCLLQETSARAATAADNINFVIFIIEMINKVVYCCLLFVFLKVFFKKLLLLRLEFIFSVDCVNVLLS